MFRLATIDILYDSSVCRDASTLSHENEVFVLDLRLNKSKKSEIINGFQVERMRLFTKKLPKNIFFWVIKYAEYLLRITCRAITKKADIYHAYNLDTLLPAYFAAKLKRAKVIYYARELCTDTTGMKGLQRKFWRSVERMLIRRVDRVIAVSDERARIMKEEYRVEQMPAVIINCPSGRTIRASHKLRDFVGSRGAGNVKIALYQGGMIQNRCLENIVRAVEYLHAGIVIVFLGYGELRDELESLAAHEGMADRVFFHDAVPASELLSYTVSADIGIVIYKNTCRNNYYCAPTKLYEYIIAGIPVVGSDFPGISPVVNRYEIGSLFDPEDVRSIADAINNVLGDKAGYTKMKKNTEKAKEVYNWEAQREKLCEVYSDLIPEEQ